MNFSHQSGHSTSYARSRLGQLGLALLITGCSGSDRALLDQLLEGLQEGHSGGSPPAGHGGGSPGPTPGECRTFLTADDVYAQVAADLSSLDADDAIFTRYLSLADQANAQGCGSALDGARSALNKLVNSLSSDASITTPEPVDVSQTLYRIDLRDYAWDRGVEVSGVAFADGWEAIIASSPYAVPFVGADADDAVADTGTTVPVLFGDAFVAAASRAPLYYALLGVPDDIDDLLANDLGVDVDDATASARFVGLAPNRAGREFLAERFELQVRAGYAWQLSALGRQRPARGERELVFTLPNGLLGHVVAEANGRVKAASDVVLDPAEDDQRAKVAHSYMREHAQGIGVIPPEAGLDAILEQDRALVATALERAGLDIDDDPEPVSDTFVAFAADVDLTTAAGELLLSAEELRDNLALLDPALGALDGGSVTRGLFEELYVESLCELSVVLENQPDPVVCSSR
jgi:hypothetical protein